ncbi:MAG TPA: hypothetical protein VGS41_18770, partial [Chthonomonadales bacterium]|nr:hypothetical protein [Chthonomonadales bacterium]
NPFDPQIATLNATLAGPTSTLTAPGFWYQGYNRALVNGTETLTPLGKPQWRVRFTPPDAGAYTLTVSFTVLRTGKTYTASLGFVAKSGPSAGYVRIAPDRASFVTDAGKPISFVGHDVCWPGSGGTFDYDTWFARMHQAGENYTRIWMDPWAFGLECSPGSLTDYNQSAAWDLDHLFALAEKYGIRLMLCLDYHGMFATIPDYWGGNNYWPENPYNSANGGPCATQDAFFTLPAAITDYEKRLRYLVARYGASMWLVAWELFNEIDNDYSFLNPSDVAAWHADVGGWLHQNDPYHHLVTTSCSDAFGHPELWSLPEIDFTQLHAYSWSQPVASLSGAAQIFLQQYGKPFLVGEYGTDWHGWTQPTVDPYLRGLRQGIWTPLFSGAVGTGMSWWWQNIDSENLYSYYAAVRSILRQSGMASVVNKPVSFHTVDELAALGPEITGGQPFTSTLALDPGWGDITPGELALTDPDRAALSPAEFNSFVQGTAHPDLVTPFKIAAWFGSGAELVMHLNSVSVNAIMQVLIDGNTVFYWSVPNKDGKSIVDEEYNIDVPVLLPKGKHIVEIANAGFDWYYLDWVKLVSVLPAAYVGSPLGVGMTDNAGSALLYLVNPVASFPYNALNASLPLWTSGSVTLQNWPAGNYHVDWYSTTSGALLQGASAQSTGADLALPVAPFTEDIAGVVKPIP